MYNTVKKIPDFYFQHLHVAGAILLKPELTECKQTLPGTYNQIIKAF